MPDTLASIQAGGWWSGDNKQFWTTINDYVTEGTFVYSNGEVADVTVVGNTDEKDFVIYDIDTDTYTAADNQNDTAYYFCTRTGILLKMTKIALPYHIRLILTISLKKSASIVVRLVELEYLFGILWSRNSIKISDVY